MNRKKRKQVATENAAYSPFQRAEYPTPSEEQMEQFIQIEMENEKVNREQAIEIIEKWLSNEVFKNELYTVTKIPIEIGGDKGFWLSIKRNNKETIHDWRHLQFIKNQIVGEENEGFELYPSEKRVVDEANQYHLFVYADPKIRIPVGFEIGRMVADDSQTGSKNRKLRES